MADPTDYPDADDPETRADGGSTTPAPLWVKVFGAIAVAVVLLFVILLFTGGHGPSRHKASGDVDKSAGRAVASHPRPA